MGSRGGDAIQRDVDGLKRWVCANLMKLNKVKCQGQGNFKHGHRLGHEWTESSPVEKDLQVAEILNMNLHHLLAKIQMYSGLHPEPCGQQIKGGRSSHFT